MKFHMAAFFPHIKEPHYKRMLVKCWLLKESKDLKVPTLININHTERDLFQNEQTKTIKSHDYKHQVSHDLMSRCTSL